MGPQQNRVHWKFGGVEGRLYLEESHGDTEAMDSETDSQSIDPRTNIEHSGIAQMNHVLGTSN